MEIAVLAAAVVGFGMMLKMLVRIATLGSFPTGSSVETLVSGRSTPNMAEEEHSLPSLTGESCSLMSRR